MTTQRRSDVERLRLFCDRVNRTLARAVQDGTIRAKWELRSSAENGMSLATDFGDDEDVRSLLLDVRRFFSDGEDVFFNAIANVVERVVQDDELLDSRSARSSSSCWTKAFRAACRTGEADVWRWCSLSCLY